MESFVEEKPFLLDDTISKILDKTSIVKAEPEEVVDTPTSLVAGTENNLLGIGIIVAVVIAIWFLLRRK